MKPLDLVSISGLSPADVQAIWSLAETPGLPMTGTVGWSFEGNGIRTRTTFIQAFRELGLQFTELPNLLKTGERADDLAGYLDPFYDAFVIRQASHEALEAFAKASERPVINAMTSAGHPCEVLTDALHLHRALGDLRRGRICLWGPTTNVFRSWHELAAVLGLDIVQACDDVPGKVDVVITDSWPGTAPGPQLPLTVDALARMGSPILLPTPPFSIGRELLFDPRDYAGFAGYEQKALLVPVQKAILRFLLG